MATSSSGIAFTGLASGLDTNALITAMLKVDQSQIDALKTNQQAVSTQVSALGTLKSKVSTLDSSMQALRFSSQVLTNQATTDVTGILSASADSTAVAGSFKVTVNQLATATRRTGASQISDQTINLTSALNSAGLALTPTAGKFMVDGQQIDASGATKLQDFIDAINNQQGTVVAEGYDVNGVASANNVVGIRLRNANGSNTAITVGSAGDTSNFLKAVKLDVAAQNNDRLESTSNLGRLAMTQALSNAHLATPAAASGTLTINGVGISWTNGDTIQGLINNINSSGANVSAAYDQVADRVVLTSKVTGSQSIAVSDTSGNLGAALGLTNGIDTVGQNAQFSIDTVAGGAVQTSTSNNVTGVVPGVTLNLQSASASPVTVTVSPDASKPLAAAKTFVAAFNDVLDFIRTNSQPNSDGTRGLFQGDLTVRMMSDQLRTMATSAVSGLSGPYRSLADLGISTGAVGSSVGTTNDLVLDESKFTAAVQSNAQGAYDLMNNTTAGSTGIFTNLRNFTFNALLPSGLIQTMTNAANDHGTDITNEIQQQQTRIDQKRQDLQSQFARMEAALAQIQSQGQQMASQLGISSASSGAKSSGSSGG